MNNSSWRYWLALSLSTVGLIAILVFILKPPVMFATLGLDPKEANDYGSYVGGFIGSLFSLAGVFLLFETLVRQQDIFERQQFETRFYELIGLHYRNVRDIPQQQIEPVHNETGRNAFGSVVSDFVYMSFLFNSDYKRDDLDEPSLRKPELRTEEKSPANFSELELIDLFFNLTYVGFQEDYDDILQKHLMSFKAKEDQYKVVQDFIASIRARPLRFGYENHFGIYFRHLYHTLKYIDEQAYLNDQEKLDYVTILRSHLSTNELASLFLYAISSVGNYPELNYKNADNLIVKYSLLRNLPRKYVLDIDHTQYYPQH